MNTPQVIALAAWLDAKADVMEAIAFGTGTPEGQALGFSVELLGLRGKASELRALARTATEGGAR